LAQNTIIVDTEIFKVSTVSIKCNEKLRYEVKYKMSNQTNKLPGTVGLYGTSESIALGYTHKTLYYNDYRKCIRKR